MITQSYLTDLTYKITGACIEVHKILGAGLAEIVYQKALEKEGMTGQGQNALNQMKDIEKQLINKGFKNETLQKMLNLKHELLKLEKYFITVI